jgi:AcrR family transcriptional regulator
MGWTKHILIVIGIPNRNRKRAQTNGGAIVGPVEMEGLCRPHNHLTAEVTMTEARPPLAERRREARVEMMAAILEVSRQVMRERGASGLNLAEVARRLGVRPPSLYEYYSGKAAIYDAVCAAAYREFEGRIIPVLEREGSIWEILRIAIAAYVRFAQENPELFEIGFLGAVGRFAPSDQTVEARRTAFDNLRGAFLKRWEAAEMDADLGPEEALDLLAATAHGLAALYVAMDPDLPLERGRFGRLIAAAVEILRRGWSGAGAQQVPQNSWGIPI